MRTQRREEQIMKNVNALKVRKRKKKAKAPGDDRIPEVPAYR
jgi:hypothetical protein